MADHKYKWLDYGNTHPIIKFLMSSKSWFPNESNGCNCIKCGEHYPYAEPNQDNGTLICYSCKVQM